MKQYLSIFFFLYSSCVLFSQDTQPKYSCTEAEYNHLIREADALVHGAASKSSLTAAIKIYRAAQSCRPQKRQEVNRKLDSVYIKIEGLNLQLLDQIKETDRALKQAELNRIIAEEKARLAKMEAKRSEQGKKTSDLAAQAGIASSYNYTHACQLADRACNVSHYLNQAATDVRKALWSDFEQLFYEKSYFHPLQSGVRQLAVSNDSRQLAIGFDNGDIIYRDIQTGQQLNKIADLPDPVTGIGLSDNNVLAYAKGMQLTLKYGNRSFYYNNATSIESVCISHDNQFVVFSGRSSDTDHSRMQWAVVNDILSLPENMGFADKMHAIPGSNVGVRHATFSTDNRLGTAGMDHLGRIYRYDETKKEFVQSLVLKGHTAPLHSIAFSNDHPYIVTTSEDGTIRLWSDSDSLALAVGAGHDNAPVFAAFIANTDYVVSCSETGSAYVWNMNGQMVYRLSGHAAPLTHAIVSPDGKYLFTGDKEGIVRRWSIAPRCEKQHQMHEGAVNTVAVLDSKRVVTAGADKVLKIWNRSTGQCVNTLKGHQGIVECIAVSPDRKYIASGARDNTIRLWSTEGVLMRTFQGHSSTVYALQFLANNRQLVSADKEGRILLWDYKNGSIEEEFSTTNRGVQTLCIGSKGNLILTAGKSGEVLMWRKNAQKWGWKQEILEYKPEGIATIVTGISLSNNDDYVLLTGGKHAVVQQLTGRKHAFTVHIPNALPVVKGWFAPSNPFNVLLMDKNGDLYHTFHLTDSMPMPLHLQRKVTAAVYAQEDGSCVLLGSSSGHARLFCLKNKEDLMLYGGNDHPIHSLFYDEHQKMVVSIDSTEVVCRYIDGRYARHWKGRNIRSASFVSQNDRTVLSLLDDQAISLYDLKDASNKVFTLPLATENSCGNLQFSPSGRYLMMEYKDSIMIRDMNKNSHIGPFANMVKAQWMTDKYLYAMKEGWPRKCVVIEVEAPEKRREFLIKEADDMTAALSPDGNKVILAGRKHGWIFLYDRDTARQYVDKIHISKIIFSVQFIDNQHFIVDCLEKNGSHSLHLYGVTRDLTAIEEQEKKRLRISPVLQEIDDCNGVFAYSAHDKSLIVAHKHEFMAWPLALMRRSLLIDSLRLPEFPLYELEADHFAAINQKHTDPLFMMDLAMYHHAYSTKERYFNQSVRLVVARRCGETDKGFCEQIKNDLEEVENKMRNSSQNNDPSELKKTCQEKYDQYISDALLLDTLYGKRDPHPIFRSKAADRYSAAAYMCILLNKPKEAVLHAERAIATDRSKTWPYSNLALACLLDGQPDKARQLYGHWASRNWRTSGYPGAMGKDSIFLDIFCGDLEYIESLLHPRYGNQFKHLEKCVKLLKEILPCIRQPLAAKTTVSKPSAIQSTPLATSDSLRTSTRLVSASDKHEADQGTKVQNPVSLLQNQTANTALPPVNHRVYAVTSGSFRQKDKADNHLKTVQLAGYTNAFVQTSGNYYVVVVRNNLTWEEMKKVKKEVRDVGIEAGHLYKTMEKK